MAQTIVQRNDYVPSVSPNRRRRWFKYLIKHSRNKKFGASFQKRTDFVEKLDKLRNVEKVVDLHKLDKMKPPEDDKDRHSKMEKKIDRVLDYQYYLENETRFNRQMLSKISLDEEGKKKEIDALRKRLEDAYNSLSSVKKKKVVSKKRKR